MMIACFQPMLTHTHAHTCTCPLANYFTEQYFVLV